MIIAEPDTLLVVAKKPAPGETKTRLCPPLTPSQAAELYDCFLRDTLDTMRSVPGVFREIGYMPEKALGYFRKLAPDMGFIFQRGASLGERLDHLLKEKLAGGSRRVVVIDSDSPTLPAEYIVQAFDYLTDSDVVLGPTHDGGYYLIGMKVPHSHLLLEVRMSTPNVLADTLALAESTGLTVSLLPSWYDVDTISDLYQLESEILGGNARRNATATHRWLSMSDLHKK
ncbi:MAG: hypothetical protein A2Z16_10555 [Chloroflexi bacterium RBG_16_54_18]|nr:MAG: hypothetical protein A2Z16_10555 [Chloroflexi bacterium RBG_16_54_18]